MSNSSTYDKAYYEAHRADKLAKVKAYYDANKSKIKARRQKYDENNRAKINARKAGYRSTGRYKDAELAYREKYRPVARSNHARWVARTIADLADWYIANCLRMKVGACPPELIEAKRLQLKIYRMTKEAA